MRNVILLTILFVLSFSVHADLDYATTANGYQANAFCSTNAKQTLEKMDKESLEGMDEIKRLKERVNELTAMKALVGGMLKINDDYYKSLNGIVSDDKNLDHFKRLIKSAMTLSAVHLVAKAKGDGGASNMGELCSQGKNAETNLCDYYSKNHRPLMPGKNDADYLNLTLINYNKAMEKITDKDKVKSELEAIYSAIPHQINPDKILTDIVKLAPELNAVLGSAADKYDILDCLKNENEACYKLMDNKKDLGKILNLQMSSVHNEFVKAKYENLTKEYSTSQVKEKVQQLKKKRNEDVFALMNKDEKSKAAMAKMGLTQEKFKEVGKICRDETKKAECESQKDELVNVVKMNNELMKQDIDETMKDLRARVEKNSKMLNHEKLRQYVANKYLRKCSSVTVKDVSSPLNCPCLDQNEIGTNLPGYGSEIEKLNKQMSSVIADLRAASVVSGKQGEVGLFAKDEIKNYLEACKDLRDKNDNYKDICQDITRESNKMAKTPELKEQEKKWEDFHKKNYAKYDSRTGKTVFIKKEDADPSIGAMAFTQTMPTVFSALLQNMAIKDQINFMTQQGLAMKQWQYMNTPGSPWMPYTFFDANYFPTTMYNPFASGVPATGATGFNFSK